MNISFARIAKTAQFSLKKNAPTILTGLGVSGFVVTTAFTIRATAKAMEILPDIKKRVQEAKETEGTDKEKSQELAKVYLASGAELARVYTPVLTLGSASIIAVLAGHNMMLKRQASLAAVYAALDASYRTYRQRVADQIGKDEEAELYHRPTMRALEEIEGIEGEPGAPSVIDMSDVQASPYAKFFDESNPNWHKTPEYNLFFLTQQQTWANQQLQAYGYLFLNDVYRGLGLPRTQHGQIVGWKSKGDGDGFVDFGIHNIWDENNRAFVNGMETSVLLDFNVDGVISI